MWAVTKSVSNYVCNRPQQGRRQPEVNKQERNIEGHIAIVTGSNHGIGKQTALELAKRGAEVIMACRDLKKGEEARQDILQQVPDSKIVLMALDLSELSTVRSFVEEVKKNYTHVTCQHFGQQCRWCIFKIFLGIYKFEPVLTKTKDGFESHIGINHLGPFLLTLLLLDLLKEAGNARIVCVASSMMTMAKLNVENLNMDNESLGYNNLIPYSNSKLANVLFVKELAKKLANTGVTAYSVCPGIVYVDNLANEPFHKRVLLKFGMTFALMDLEHGSANILYCILDKRLENESGKFYRFLGPYEEINQQLDDDQAVALWKISETLVGCSI